MIRLSKSSVGKGEAQAVQAVMARAFFGMGNEVNQFEQEIQKFLGEEPEVVCVNTGTAALHLALQALDVGPGDEVLVPSLTYVATFQAISATGATPVACDVELDTALLDLKDAAGRVTTKTKAIVPVHYAGDMGNLNAVYSFAESHGLRVVEDAAHAFGCHFQGKRVGATGDVVCFSFDGIKNITSGEGGAVVTHDKKVADRIKDLRLLGVIADTEKRYRGERSWEFEVVEQGWRYHMSDLMAAIGRVQLKRFETELMPPRQRLARRYRDNLKGMPQIQFFSSHATETVPFMMPIRILNGRRNSVRKALLDQQIQCGIHYYPNHLLAKYSVARVSLPVCEQLFEELLTLPLHPEISNEEVDQICDLVRKSAESI